MARICPLFSGSSGNATFIKDGENSLLIDAGASFKQLAEAVSAAGGEIEKISGVLITHEHSDHTGALRILLKKTGIPVYASQKTLSALAQYNLLPEGAETFCAEEIKSIGNFGVTRFETSHDCEGSSGYSLILPSNKKVTVCTDLGIVTDTVRDAICGSDVLLFESNHDIQRLKNGPYPPALKLRILSDKGHLSNNACAAELPAFLQKGTTRFILGHLSLHNNLPMLALSSAKATLSSLGAKSGEDYIITAAKPHNNEVTAI